MSCFRTGIALTLLLGWIGPSRADDPPPRSLDPRLKVALFAENPQLVTPTGIDVDRHGRVWAIESNTHFPPEGYQGHPSDRLLVLRDSDGDGKADEIAVFADGFTHAMSVAVADGVMKRANGDASAKGAKNQNAPSPSGSSHSSTSSKSSHPLSAFVATRREILLLVDGDGDLKADRRERIVHLDTPGNYPHNGLAGFAFDALGWMYFGFGENLGASYKLIGSDGTTLSGGGEGGNVYRCRPDGTRLSQVATGFWNPHASCVDAFGRLFTVDNDPDSRPPCRLLHVIPHGDYGYRFRNGRKGLHPFTAWNGEVAGTLPMVAGTGEAPSGIVAYESDGLPVEYRGTLLGTSWGDHRIERFRLSPKGASFQSLAEPIVTGGENFRPVGIAVAPDGSVYFTDWVLRDYKLHGKGRIWRLSAVNPPKRSEPDDVVAHTQKKVSVEDWAGLLESPRIEVRRFAARYLAPTVSGRRALIDVLQSEKASPRARAETLWALLTSDRPPETAQEHYLTLGVFRARDVVSTAAAWEIGAAALNLHDQQVRKELNLLLGVLLSEDAADVPIDRGFVLPLLAKTQWEDNDRLVPAALSVRDPFVVATMVPAMAERLSADELAKFLNPGAGTAVEIAQAMALAARRKDPRDTGLLTLALGHPTAEVKRIAVQWVAEEKHKDLRPHLERILNSGATTSDLLLATLAGLEMLDGVNPAQFDQTPASKYVLAILKDEKRPPALHAQVLKLVAPTAPELTADLYRRFLASDNATLRLEAVRTLQGSPLPEGAEMLGALATSPAEGKPLRNEATLGLALAAVRATGGNAAHNTLVALLRSGEETVRTEALRSVRGLAPTSSALRDAARAVAEALPPAGTRPADADRELAEQIALALAGTGDELPERVAKLRPNRPSTKADWLAALSKGREVDVEAGRRAFYHPNGAGCFKCHTIDGRGGKVGPDLTNALRTLNRPQIVEAILEPSREIAPQYVAWTFTMKSGQVITGMVVQENEGRLTIGDAEGKTIDVKTADVDERAPQKVSVMPDRLADRMTLQEFRDLLAYLDSFK